MLLETILILTTLFGLYHFAKGLRKIRRRQRIRGSAQIGSGAFILALSALSWGLGSHLYTYNRLSKEQLVATLEFQLLGPQLFQANIEFSDGGRSQMQLTGDEFRIEARVLKWHGVSNLFGIDALYRLDRLSGRYRDVRQEIEKQRTAYQLTANAGLDVWQIARSNTWLPWVDAEFGSGVYVPMADNSRYQVSLSQSGLVVRPANEVAGKAVKKWP